MVPQLLKTSQNPVKANILTKLINKFVQNAFQNE